MRLFRSLAQRGLLMMIANTQRATLAFLKWSAMMLMLCICACRDSRFDRVDPTSLIGLDETAIVGRFGKPSWSRWYIQFENLPVPIHCRWPNNRVDGPGLLTIESGRAMIYFDPDHAPSLFTNMSLLDCVLKQAERIGVPTYVQELESSGMVVSSYKAIGYHVVGDGGGLDDETFRIQLALDGTCTMAALKRDF
jgi:hypothetical protein